MKVTEDNRPTNRYHRWLQQNEEEGKPLPKDYNLWRAFIAGWHARLDVALDDYKVWGTDDSVLQDYVKIIQTHFDRVCADNWKLRGLLHQKQNLIDAWYTAKEEERQDKYAVRDGKADQRLVDLPLWKRISMQRKELRELHREIGYWTNAFHRKNNEVNELKRQIEELKGQSDV